MWDWTAKSPDLDAPIQTSRGESVGILGVELDHHDIVRVPLEELSAFKIAIPIPQLDGHVVTASEEVGQGGVHLHISDVVGMSLKVLDFLHGVVVINPDPHVIARADNPLFASDEFGTADWQFGHLEGLDVGSRLVVPDGHVA